jgi:hypothetical protein
LYSGTDKQKDRQTEEQTDEGTKNGLTNKKTNKPITFIKLRNNNSLIEARIVFVFEIVFWDSTIPQVAGTGGRVVVRVLKKARNDEKLTLSLTNQI